MRFAMVFAVGILGAAACTDQPDELGSSSQSVTSQNRLSSNRLASNRLASNRLASNRLASNRLASNHLEADAVTVGDLIETADGRDLLTYVISCALPEDVTFTATDSHGNAFDFFGGLGLAPKWADRPLDKQGQRWVSACLFSRVNHNDVTVNISMRGPHAELTSDAAEQAAYPLQEGAFWGTWFVDATEDIQWYSCRGKDKAATPDLGGLEERDCTLADPANPGHTVCGFIDAGDCGDFALPKSEHACNHFSAHGFWISCAAGNGNHHANGGDDDNDWHHNDNATTHDNRHDDHDDGDCDHDDDDDGHGHGQNGHGRGRFHQVITTFVQAS